MKNSQDASEAIASYITDMLALEKHIEEAVSGQIADLDEYPDIVNQLRPIHAMCELHIASLEQMADQRKGGGQTISGTVKKAASAILGIGAAGVDFIRSAKLPKDLRDDYTALSLACIGYVMLHTTAAALDDDAVADLAKRHLEAHAGCVMTLHNMIPAAVMTFLQEEGYSVRTERLADINRATRRAWQTEDSAVQPGFTPA